MLAAGWFGVGDRCDGSGVVCVEMDVYVGVGGSGVARSRDF